MRDAAPIISAFNLVSPVRVLRNCLARITRAVQGVGSPYAGLANTISGLNVSRSRRVIELKVYGSDRKNSMLY